MNSLWPSIPVLLVYGTFFGAGWLLHRQAGLLREMRPHWKWHLGAGVALSIPLFATYHYLSAWRVAQPAVALSPQYPLISPAQVSDWPRFLTALQAMNQDDSPELRNFWWHFSAGQRTALESLRGLPDPEVQGGICIAINKLLAMPGVFASPTQKNLTGNVTGKVTPPGSTLSRNRRKFDTLFHETAGQDPHLWRWFRPVKLIYSVVYALVSCMLVFGTLGCFQEFCAGHNPVWRYISDSAYWIYLVHLPLVAALQVWMRGWAWPGAEKCLLLTLIAFAVLFASYHYLVRSTFIGLVLNGQRYPFRPLPWKIKPRSSLRPSEVVSVIGMTRE